MSGFIFVFRVLRSLVLMVLLAAAFLSGPLAIFFAFCAAYLYLGFFSLRLVLRRIRRPSPVAPHMAEGSGYAMSEPD